MGFNLFKLNLFGGNAFKQAQFLISKPPDAQAVEFFSEQGFVSHEFFSLGEGWMTFPNKEQRGCFEAIHLLKLKVYMEDQEVETEQVFLLCGRTYRPLDPCNILTKEDLQNRGSLGDVSIRKYDEAVAIAGQLRGNEDICEKIVAASFVILGLDAIFGLIKWAMSR